MPNLLLLSGSPSATSRSAAVLEYIRELLIAEKLEVRLLSIRDFPPEDLLFAKYESPAFDELKTLLADADGLVVSTPIYKAAYSGALKSLLDILPQLALRGKTVLPIATGGTPAHLLAIDYALKPVLSALGATDLLQGVFIVDKELQLDSSGRPIFSAELGERLHQAVFLLATSVRSRTAVA